MADSGSRNGTFLNGRRLAVGKFEPLSKNDVLCFGADRTVPVGEQLRSRPHASLQWRVWLQELPDEAAMQALLGKGQQGQRRLEPSGYGFASGVHEHSHGGGGGDDVLLRARQEHQQHQQGQHGGGGTRTTTAQSTGTSAPSGESV